MLRKYLKQFSIFIIQNVLISLEQDVSILFVNDIYFGKIFEQFGT